MALRLIEMILPEKGALEIWRLLQKAQIIEHRQIRLPDGEIWVRILLNAEQNEEVLDLLEKQYTSKGNSQVIILSVVATLPHAKPLMIAALGHQPERIGREEWYENIQDAIRCSRVYLAMVSLSTIVAAVGLHNNSVTIIIGAMVIAPMLGPSMALELCATLGDMLLLRKALLTGLIRIATAMALSIIIGTLIHMDPTLSEVASRTRVDTGDIVVALAAGSAGAFALTTGVSSILIGVMVAVALLPPLVTFGLLLGSGQSPLAMGALSVFLVNLICVNLAGVITFLAQGIHPLSWRDKGRAVKATYIAIGLWVAMLATLVVLIRLL